MPTGEGQTRFTKAESSSLQSLILTNISIILLSFITPPPLAQFILLLLPTARSPYCYGHLELLFQGPTAQGP